MMKTFNFVYDQSGQLIQALPSVLENEQFDYDSNGNRISDGNKVGENNQILSNNDFDYDYDAEGNLTGRLEIATGHITEYTYDHRNRLTRVEKRDANDIVLSEGEFIYDALDRRIGKITENETIFTIYDGENAWSDFDEGGNPIAHYLFGNRMDEIYSRYKPGEGSIWYLTDNIGSVHDLIDNGGSISNHIDYASFGRILGQSNSDAGDRFLFTGREFDAETGLYYYRARHYDPHLGRFISQDPIGFDGGDLNLYRYVGNSPENGTDPTGTIEFKTLAILVCGISSTVFFATPIALAIKNTFEEIAFVLERGGPSYSFNPTGAAAGLDQNPLDALTCGVPILPKLGK